MKSGVEQIRAMARNNAWSNHRLLNACAELTREELDAQRTSFFPSIMLTLNHILIVDWYYLDALEEGGLGPAAYADETPCATLPDLHQAQTAADRRLVRYCDGLTETRLAGSVLLVRENRDRYRERVDAILLHLLTHQIHHRGQVHAMLAGTRVAPPQLDEFYQVHDAPLRAREVAMLGFAEPTF